MTAEVSSLLAEIESALRDSSATAGEVERTLTTGYARALALEGERLRLEREIAFAARRLADGDTEVVAGDLAAMSNRLTSADDELSTLRACLRRLRRRADALRAA